MKLKQAWDNMLEALPTEQAQLEFWNGYYSAETECYKKILAAKEFNLEGTAQEIADKLGIEPVMLAGFIDGINTSLSAAVDLEPLEETTALKLDIIPETLYYNMINAKAKWLYELKEWDDILTAEKRKEILFAWRADHTAVSNKKVGRNDPCPCGSGKKYKNCCGV